MIFTSPRTLTPRLRAGFGLVELMVSIGIMVLVMSVVLINHNSFSRGSLLRSQAYEIALRLRETQLLAVSTRVTEGDSQLRYGARFSTASSTRFQVFAIPKDVSASTYGSYLVGTPGVLDSRFAVTKMTRVNSLGAENDVLEGGVLIIFNRPNFDAEFYDPTDGSRTEYNGMTEVRLYVDSVRSPGSPRKIIITRAGQISVQ